LVERFFQVAIRSKEELVDKIARDHVWRIREINDFKHLVDGASVSEIRKRVLCRAGISLLYSHWEGFIKKTGTYFLEYVSNQQYCMSELKSNFISLQLHAKFNSVSASNKYSPFENVTKYILENQGSKIRVPHKNIVDTQSNLSTTVLKEIVWCLGLSYDQFQAKEKMIDLKLVGRRNHVAHGEELEVSNDDFLEMVTEVLSLMTIFKNLVENSAITESFKAA